MRARSDEFDLTAELRALREQPEQELAASLDARVAAGFPRQGREPVAALGRLAKRLRSVPPRRLLAPAGAIALFGVIAATALLASRDGGIEGTTALREPDRGATVGAPQADSGTPPDTSSGGRSSSGVEYSDELPRLKGVEGQSSSAASAGVNAGSAESTATGPYATPAKRREVEHSATIVLGTAPTEVRASAAKVFDAVHAVDGIVLRSSIRDGSAGEAGASFELLIPSARLGDALADLSAIAEVRSRREASQDITAPTVRTGEKLQDSRARIESLLVQLAEATTEAERIAVETQLRGERRQNAALRSELATLQRRANLSRVSVRIETGAGTDAEEGGSWGPGDGLAAAGRILAVAAGVALVGLAILAPLALLALLAAFAYRTHLRRARHRALAQ
jgi:Domain of unknown function (DUF4349)